MVLSHERPFPRPAIPLLLQCGVVFWFGCLLSWLLDYDVALSAGLSLVSLAFLFATYRISCNSRSGFKLLLAWALFFFLGATLMSVSINGLHHKREVLAGSDGALFAVRILEDPTRGSFGYSVPALIVEPNSDFIRKQLYSYKVVLNYESGSFEYGDEFLAKVDISSIDEHYLDYFDRKGIVARCSVSDLRPVHSSQFGQLSELRLSVLLCIVLWLAWPRAFPTRAIVSICVALLLCIVPMRMLDANSTSIVMLDVGQGDSFLVKSRGLTLLIDTGNNPRKLLAGLARHGVNRLDGVVISHADDDHCGCLSDLRGVVSVDSVFVAKGLSSVGTDKVDDMLKDAERLSSASGIRELVVGDMITIGSVCFMVISPEGLTDKGENDDSICLIATTDLNDDGMGEWRALFTGDAESEVLDSLNREGALEDIDILKVGHHGAKSALDEELMDVLKPEIALISVGERNRYGHPAANTVSLLESSDVEVFRTDLQGDVVCSLSQTSISIHTMK